MVAGHRTVCILVSDHTYSVQDALLELVQNSSKHIFVRKAFGIPRKVAIPRDHEYRKVIGMKV
jgi:hypothetical protein|eukprot:2435-Pelagococcus_subviridis.AAC.3